MPSDVWYLSDGDTGPELAGTLESQDAAGVWNAQDLTGATVTLTLVRTTGTVYKSGLPVTIVGSPTAGTVKYSWAAADSAQGFLKGKFRVLYANGLVWSFPNNGWFKIKVSR